MPELKRLERSAIPGAMAKAERYRFLNEPREAESICRDVLAVDPSGQGGREGAVATLILSLTDQFAGADGLGNTVSPEQVLPLVERLDVRYDRAYLTGIIWERWAKAELSRQGTGLPGYVLHEWLERAMASFEEAEELAPAGNEEAVLRWNSCVRIMQRCRDVIPRGVGGASAPDLADY